MTYVLSKLLWGLVQPLNLIVALILAAAGLGAVRLYRAARVTLCTGLVLLVTLTLLPIGQLILIPLENRFPAPSPLPEQVDGIIVLGGPILGEISLAHQAVTFNNAGERMTQALALARRYPDAKLVFTGGSADVVGPSIPEAAFARIFFLEQGLPADRVIYERKSRNTWENAVNSRAIVAPKPGERWLLVTSAFHMPRSVGIFRRAGWPVIPYPVDYRTIGGINLRGFKLVDRLDEVDVALKEWVGLIAYRLLGRTDALFPGPA